MNSIYPTFRHQRRPGAGSWCVSAATLACLLCQSLWCSNGVFTAGLRGSDPVCACHSTGSCCVALTSCCCDSPRGADRSRNDQPAFSTCGDSGPEAVLVSYDPAVTTGDGPFRPHSVPERFAVSIPLLRGGDAPQPPTPPAPSRARSACRTNVSSLRPICFLRT